MQLKSGIISLTFRQLICLGVTTLFCHAQAREFRDTAQLWLDPRTPETNGGLCRNFVGRSEFKLSDESSSYLKFGSTSPKYIFIWGEHELEFECTLTSSLDFKERPTIKHKVKKKVLFKGGSTYEAKLKVLGDWDKCDIEIVEKKS